MTPTERAALTLCRTILNEVVRGEPLMGPTLDVWDALNLLDDVLDENMPGQKLDARYPGALGAFLDGGEPVREEPETLADKLARLRPEHHAAFTAHYLETEARAAADGEPVKDE